MMPSQIYKVLCDDRSGKKVVVCIPAWPGENIACGRRLGGCQLLRAWPAPWPALLRWRHYPRGKALVRLRIDFLWRLGLLIKAGVSLTEALDQLGRSGCPRLIHWCIIGMLIDLNQGKNFAQSLERLRWLFPPRLVGMVRHAEQTGRLGEVLDKLVASDEWLLDCSTKMTRALLYPSILLAIMLAIALVMVYMVIPNFAQLLIDSGKMDPANPEWWWLLARGLREPGAMVALGGSLAATLALAITQRHRIVGLLPATRKLLHSRQMHLFEFLYEAGIPLPDVLLALGDSEGDRRDRRRYLGMAQMLRQGNSLAEALERAPVMSPLVRTLLCAGEACGRLGFAAEQAGSCLEREASESMKSFEQWLTPVCLLIMGGMMAWFFSSLTSVLYDFGQAAP